MLISLLPASALAQDTNASIIGQVKDESGAVLPGVSVSATSPALQVPAVTTVTDAQGEYRLTPLPIGTYAVEYTLSGFQGTRQENLRLTVGFSAKIDIVMKLGSVTESITVSGAAPVVDVTSTRTSTQLTRETLELTPTDRNGIMTLISQAPGVRSNLDIGGSGINSLPGFRAFGQSGEPWATLEGVLTTALQASGGNGNYWDYASVEEANVTTLGSNADMPTRGVLVSAVVKSGGNDFHGDLFGAITNHNFVSNNIDDALKAQGITTGNPIDRQYDASGGLGGRILRDKLWFYTSARRREQWVEVLGATKPDGSPIINEDIQNWRIGKLSYQLSKSNRLVGFYQRNHKVDLTVANVFTAFESLTLQTPVSHTEKIEWQGTRGNSLALSAQTGFWDYADGPKGYDDNPQKWPTPDGGYTTAPATRDIFTQRIAGEWTGAGEIAGNARYHTKAVLTWFKPSRIGNHEIKTGGEYLSNSGGRQQVPRASGNVQLIFNNGVAQQIATWNYPTYPEQKTHYSGVFVQDNWTLARRLTLNLGLRYARDNGFTVGSCRDAALPPAAAVWPAACFPDTQFPIWSLVSPRLRAAFDVSGDGKTVIKGGWGRYAHLRQMEPELVGADPLAKATATFRWRDTNGNRLFDTGESNLDPNGPDFVSIAGANQVVNPNEIDPQTDEISGSIERELIRNFSVRVTGIYSRTFNVYRLENVPRPRSAFNIPVSRPDPGPDGVAGNTDDPGKSITYYEYPTSLRGAAFDIFQLANDPNATQKYKSIEVAGAKRLANRWMFMTSYSATKKNIPIVSNPNPTSGEFNSTATAGPFNPNAEIFAADNTWEWLGKAQGAYMLPGDITTSAIYEARGGYGFARTVVFATGGVLGNLTLPVEPIGTRKLPNVHSVNVRAEKAFGLGGGRKLTARLNVYNLTNVNTPVTVNQQSGPTFLRPLTIMPPRTFEFGATFAF